MIISKLEQTIASKNGAELVDREAWNIDHLGRQNVQPETVSGDRMESDL